jgi:hypothetical protein
MKEPSRVQTPERLGRLVVWRPRTQAERTARDAALNKLIAAVDPSTALFAATLLDVLAEVEAHEAIATHAPEASASRTGARKAEGKASGSSKGRASDSLDGKLEASAASSSRTPSTLREAMAAAPRLYPEPTPKELDGFTHDWIRITGQLVTEKMRKPLAVVLPVHGHSEAPAVLERRYEALGTRDGLIPAMLTPEEGDEAPGSADHGDGDPARPFMTEEIEEALDSEDDATSSPFGHSTIDPEIEWRVEAMRPQYRSTGPIPQLRARPDQVFQSTDECVSCGEQLGKVRPVCELCQAAAKFVLGDRT